MTNPFYKSYQFWTMIAAFVAFLVKYFYPAIPVTAPQILTACLLVLGFFGITVAPTLSHLALPTNVTSLLSNMNFWVMLTGIVSFIAYSFYPNFPLNSTSLLAVVLLILTFFGIKPELVYRGLIKPAPAQPLNVKKPQPK